MNGLKIWNTNGGSIVKMTGRKIRKIQRSLTMKSFKEFLENYDVYLDKPMGFVQPEEENTEEEEEETEEG